jgi:putative protein-disulfide isomerase
MCAFCYGFSDIIRKFYNTYKEIIDFEILPGGLWIDENVKVLNDEVAEKLKGVTKRITELSGKPFGIGFYDLLRSESVFDSMKGILAMTAASELMADPFDLLEYLQTSLFVEGLHPSDEKTYIRAENELGIKQLNTLMNSHKIKEIARSTIQRSKELGVRSYPTVLVEDGQNIYSYPINYSDYDLLVQWFEKCK